MWYDLEDGRRWQGVGGDDVWGLKVDELKGAQSSSMSDEEGLKILLCKDEGAK